MEAGGCIQLETGKSGDSYVCAKPLWTASKPPQPEHRVDYPLPLPVDAPRHFDVVRGVHLMILFVVSCLEGRGDWLSGTSAVAGESPASHVGVGRVIKLTHT